MKRCNCCCWWVRANGNKGECRYNPPTIVDGRSRHPEALGESWCSKHSSLGDWRCETCVSWIEFDRDVDGDADDTIGMCRRYPPIFRNEENVGNPSDFSITRRHEWCGEYQENEET